MLADFFANCVVNGACYSAKMPEEQFGPTRGNHEPLSAGQKEYDMVRCTGRGLKEIWDALYPMAEFGVLSSLVFFDSGGAAVLASESITENIAMRSLRHTEKSPLWFYHKQSRVIAEITQACNARNVSSRCLQTHDKFSARERHRALTAPEQIQAATSRRYRASAQPS